MSYVDEKLAPIREDRLGASMAFGGKACELKRQWGSGCLKNNDRSFCQGSICQLLPGTAILNSIADAVVIVHGAIGCGGSGNSQSASIRWRQMLAGETNPRGALWLSTGLDERDVISGGEGKLEEAILEADRRYHPAAIIVISTCVPSIIGDDIDGVADRLRDRVNAAVLPVHCEGFKTQIMATAYDAIYHSIARNLLEVPEEEDKLIFDELAHLEETFNQSRTVNLLNVSSMTPGDEQELTRLLSALDLKVNIFPCFAHPERMRSASQAALSVSTCPTHDDYFVRHLEEKYGIPYILQHMPVGIINTNQWLLATARFFGQEDSARRFIEREQNELEEALLPFRESLKGKRVMLSTGEVRTLATANWLQELGMGVVAVRPYHYDEFGDPALNRLAGDTEIELNVATVQPFEAVNLIAKLKPDVYLGHNSDNVWAAKAGIPAIPIYGGPYTYVGYTGAFDLARRLDRILRNPSFNINLGRHTRQPYFADWYETPAYSFIAGGESHE